MTQKELWVVFVFLFFFKRVTEKSLVQFAWKPCSVYSTSMFTSLVILSLCRASRVVVISPTYRWSHFHRKQKSSHRLVSKLLFLIQQNEIIQPVVKIKKSSISATGLSLPWRRLCLFETPGPSGELRNNNKKKKSSSKGGAGGCDGFHFKFSSRPHNQTFYTS